MTLGGFGPRLRRILIVAADDARGRRLASLIESEGLEPVIAAAADEADANPPDGDFAAVVVDERCLESAAGELVKTLRRRDPELRVVVDTSNGFPGVTTSSSALDECAPVLEAGDTLELLLCVQRAVRARYEERLQRVEEQLAHVSAASSDGMLVIDPLRERIVAANPRVARLLEYAPGELVQLPAVRVLPDAMAGLRRLVSAKRSGGRAHTLELDCRTRGGMAVPVEMSASVLRAGGQPLILVLLRDLRDSRHAQRALTESEERLRAVFDHSPVTIDLKDTEGRYLLVNRNYAAQHDETVEAISGVRTTDVYPREAAEAIRAHELAVLDWGKAIEREYRIRRNGAERTQLVVKFPIRDAEGEIAGIGGIGTDITERKRAEAALALSEERFQGLYDNSPDMYFTVVADGTVTSVNQFGAEYLGYSKDALIGKPFWTLIHSEDLSLVQGQIGSAFENRAIETELEFRMIRQDESVLWVQERVRLLAKTSSAPAELRVVCRDVTEAHNLSEELTYQASHDSLTGLVNRRELENRLARVLETARTDGSHHALCYLDLDQFKVINDTCGHVAGDELLRQLAEVLRTKVRRRDTLARLGGDEFGVLMEHCALRQAQRVANTLRKCVEEFRFSWENKTFSVGVSIGLVPVTSDSESVAGTLSAADTACYVAKDQGRNRIHVYHPEDIELARRHGEMQWVARINQALEEDRFCLSVQPIRPLSELSREGSDVMPGGDGQGYFELLLRMRDANGRLVPPGAFLPAAERYSLSVRLDRWVVEKIFSWLDAHPEQLRRLAMCSINLSGHSIADEEFLQFVISSLDRTNVPAEKLCFEITETAAITNLVSATRFITALKGWGCHFALDDFGSGLSSFAYLKQLAVDFLKIDGVFVKDVVDDPINLAMVKSINDIGKVMGKRTIAEFVESDGILEKLREVGVDYAQGYRIGRPKPLERLLTAEPTEIPAREPLRPAAR
ncbi:MAG: EAL domain-containing protein [Gammaproteobacteria bacterium]|nr:EAL domain-containing protein [Gammaproteobacteria bacterium]NIM73838.1 EAL domain-containing protein [Gammaproteobacteria bacterium]NIN39415.1 EAL domain-containing protein [Gammaproteobacteria bacterium]NIO25080.1 EAL domain-containing protein [Gammaproteobacteria bacterium]NIO65712.1 EAL domain-containing protein [Gammaproteobacteria bacterium]